MYRYGFSQGRKSLNNTAVYVIKSYKGEIKTIILIFSVPKSQNSNEEKDNSITATLWMKFQKNRPRAWAGSSLVIG